MTRRTAFQSLVAIVCGYWSAQQQRVQARQASKTTTTGKLKIEKQPLAFADIDPPASMRIYMGWKDITVFRGDESVTIDQDELFRALKGDPK